MTAAGRHDATASLLGYMYQVHVALLELMRRAAETPAIAMRMEVLDDVSFEVEASPMELLQTKHPTQGSGQREDTYARVANGRGTEVPCGARLTY